jgi:hypothetical protein
MLWLWIAVAVAVALLLLLASLARRRKQKTAVATLRTRFPHIARLRLAAACPGLDGLLHEADLRLLFDWIMLQLYGRTHTSNFVQLMQWTINHGESESLQLVAEVTREAVDRLPAPVLHIIDGCEGRTVAGVILDQALSESGRRFRTELERKAA